jgi:hypothetical protein
MRPYQQGRGRRLSLPLPTCALVAPAPLPIGHPLEEDTGLDLERCAETVEGVGREAAEPQRRIGEAVRRGNREPRHPSEAVRGPLPPFEDRGETKADQEQLR